MIIKDYMIVKLVIIHFDVEKSLKTCFYWYKKINNLKISVPFFTVLTGSKTNSETICAIKIHAGDGCR